MKARGSISHYIKKKYIYIYIYYENLIILNLNKKQTWANPQNDETDKKRVAIFLYLKAFKK